VRTLLQKAATKTKNPFESLTAGSSDDLETDYRNWDPSGVAVAAAERERRSMLGPSHPIPLTALQEDDVLAEVEQTYFKSDFDSCAHELRKYTRALSEEEVVDESTASFSLDQGNIDRHRQILLRQLKVVTKRAFALILEQRPRCAEEMVKVQALTIDLERALESVRSARVGLDRSRQEFTKSSLGILAAYKRRERAMTLVKDLEIISTLQKTDARLQELLAEGNYPGAIRLLIEGQKAVETFKRFTAIQQLSVKLQDTLEMAEESLDVALSKVCVDFHGDRYRLLIEAYGLLGQGKTHSSMDQLLMHLTSAIHNTAWNVVYGHAVLSSPQHLSPNSAEDLSKKLYTDICAHVATSSLLPCLVDLCKSLWNIMNSYKKILAFHQTHSSTKLMNNDDFPKSDDYVQRKLVNGLSRIWQDVQTKVRLLVISNEMNDVTIDQFIRIIGVVHQLITIGGAFCQSTSSTLAESLKQKCLAYFQNYHLERLQELRMHLLNESWTACPVKDSFNLYQLQEYFQLNNIQTIDSPSKQKCSSDWIPECPFDLDNTLALQEDFLVVENPQATNLDQDSSSDEELKRDFIPDGEFVASTPSSKKHPAPFKGGGHRPQSTSSTSLPVITTTSLMVLRLCGKYLRVMQMLQPIARDVFVAMTQLMEYYFINVHHMFTQDLRSESHHAVPTFKFTSYLDRVRASLIKPEPIPQSESVGLNSINKSLNKTSINNFLNDLNKSSSSPTVRHPISDPDNQTGVSQEQPPAPAPTPSSDLANISQQECMNLEIATLSPVVDLTSPERLHGFEERYVAAESLAYLVSQVQVLRPHVMSAICDKDTEEFFQQRVDLIKDVRRSIYLAIAQQSINSDSALRQMSKVNWDIKEVQTQHNQYVDNLLRELQVFSMRLQDFGSLTMAKESLDIFWEMASFATALIFVEGFSEAKRCSNEGRALMQLDYRQFAMKMELISAVKPLPHQDLVTQYIKAFYIPEADLENWVKYHTEYSPKQLISLVSSVAYSNNKTRQKLNKLISDVSDKIRKT